MGDNHGKTQIYRPRGDLGRSPHAGAGQGDRTQSAGAAAEKNSAIARLGRGDGAGFDGADARVQHCARTRAGRPGYIPHAVPTRVGGAVQWQCTLYGYDSRDNGHGCRPRSAGRGCVS